MTVLRPQLRGLVSKLALFYLLLSLPTLVVVESAILIYEFGHFMRGVADGSLDRAGERGAADLAARWPNVREADHVALATWLEGWVLRLQQPRGGLTPDESYVLMELADAPLAAAILAADGHELARSTGDGRWAPSVPSAAELAEATRATDGGAIRLAGADTPYRIRRAIVPIRDTSGQAPAFLFVELRVPLPWRHLLVDSSFESPTVFGFLVVFGIASSLFLAWWVTRRLNRVARAATAWSRGDFSDRIADPSRDELGGLSALLDRMALDLRGLMRSRAQLATLAERQRLARDLHDTVKQKAFALNLQLATARRVIGEAAGGERLEQAQRLTQQIQQELAQILDELRASDAALPLTERMRARAIEWSHTSGLLPAFDFDEVPPLPSMQEESLLRILDEALANVLRHARATRVEIALRREADRVRLAIIDNGSGIATDSVSGMGLDNMRQRAEMLPAGRFELVAPAGRGTRVAVSFVVAENPNP